jgi:2-amino-4-hydroxy-6-hydroxymethyldihydropteridine diphosphokinase
MQRWQPAYVGIGSNLEQPHRQVLRAWEALGRLPATRRICRSPLYGSRPFGPVAQPDFVNAVAGVLTRLDVGEFFAALQTLEASLGRSRDGPRWGPRVIDLDLLVFGRERCETPQLRLPHPGIVERNFVLYPLADIAPELDVPGLARVRELSARLGPEGLWRLDPQAYAPDVHSLQSTHERR